MEKLEFINVVSMDTGVIGSIITFPFPNTNIPAQQETAKAAEEYFTNLVKGIDEEISDSEIEELIEDGSYRDMIGGNEVHIIWSENTATAANS